MSNEGHKAYKLVTDAAAETESDKITIIWNVDGPIALGESSHWLTILSCSIHDQKVNWLNVDNVPQAQEMIRALKDFVKSKKAEEKKKSK